MEMRCRILAKLRVLLWLAAAAFLMVGVGSRIQSAGRPGDEEGFGPLVKDKNGILDLPQGFKYKIIAQIGDKMSDGFYAPGLADGMTAAPGPGGLTILVCNHEFRAGHPVFAGPFKGKDRLLKKLPGDLIYDRGGGAGPCLGSVTTLLYDTKSRKLRAHFLSLVGTLGNCSGGVTPWTTWLSCEEVFENPGDQFAQRHGYVFEGPISAIHRWTRPVPLKAMGRFQHEGAAVLSQSGIVYLTEDQPDGLFYRFIPNRPGNLAGGGRLQCLAIVDRPGFETRNWNEQTVVPGGILSVRWIDLENVDPETDDLRQRGHQLGAALFGGGEGICFGDGKIYFACTNGGRTGRGQVWSYTPSPAEAALGEQASPGQLELLVEPNDAAVMDHPDQLTIAPWGDIFVCEDGEGENYLLGITARNRIYKFALNAFNESDLSGVCFSPDSSTMFLNILEPGVTFAITGPWKKSREAESRSQS